MLLSNALHLVRWVLIITPLAVLVGSASAGFLWLLESATRLRLAHGWLLFFLPLAGLALAWVYRQVGKSVEGGNNLILDQIHQPGGGVPKRMAPLILFATVATHLFGGSAGREGTAVQMGGSIASGVLGIYRRWFTLYEGDTRLILMAGVSAGFASVFGTPLAGAIFAMEVLTIGQLNYKALLPVLIAALAGDATCRGLGAHHTAFNILYGTAGTGFSLEPLLLLKVCVAAIAFGLVAWFFSEAYHLASKWFEAAISNSLFRPVAGGLMLIGLTYLLGTRDYLGLGDIGHAGAVTLTSAFEPGGATPWSWFWKLVFTVITLSCGFKGGEVTPLFFIGATLGNAMATLLGAPVDLFAGLGFIAVFAAAANTPLACISAKKVQPAG